jgi:hypothetical protein
MALSISSGVLFAIVCFLSSGSTVALQHETALAPKDGTVGPKWRTDLRSAIENVPLGEVFGHVREYKALPRTSLWFTNNDTIVATLVTREDKLGLSSRDSSDSTQPLRLRPVFLNADTGKVIGIPDWPINSRDAGIVAVHNGRFIVQAGSELTLYASDLTPLKKLKLPELATGEWIAHPSPTGKKVLFLPPGHRTGSWLWLETDTLLISRSWEDTQTGDVAIADDWIAMVTCTWVHNCQPEVEVKGVNTDWTNIAPGYRQSSPQFISSDMVFVSGNPTRLIRTDGKVVFVEDKLAEGCWWGRAFPSADAERFVVPACAVKGAAGALDIGGHTVLKKIFLYDSSHQKSYTIDLKGPTIKNLTLLAVSPDGLQLAILNDNSVEVIQLPPLQ